MKTRFLVFAFGIFSIGLLHAEESTIEAKKWNGTWTVKRLQIEGIDAPTDVRNKVTVVIEGKQLTVKGFSPIDVKNTFSIRANKNPAEIDLTPMEATSSAGKGIFRFEGNSLSICVTDSGDRPKEFSTKPKSGQVLMILERVQ